MQRYFVDKKDKDLFYLSKDDSHHIINVMRMNIKDKIEVVYDNKLYICELINIDTPIKCKIVEEVNESKELIPQVIIAQALVKEQKMDLILQKSCELGVYKIIPFNCSRSIIKVNKDSSNKVKRWEKILKEASEQSKRTEIPIINDIIEFKELINIPSNNKYVCNVKEKEKTIKRVLSNVKKSDTMVCVIGPEGGFSDNEIQFLIDNGFESISLGNNVLRTETASSFILSCVNYEYMR